MSILQSNNPPQGTGTAGPRVHHPQQGRTGGPAQTTLGVRQAMVELGLTAADLNNPLVIGQVRGNLPVKLVDHNGRPFKASDKEAPKPDEVQPREQRVKKSTDGVYAGLIDQQDTLPGAVEDVVYLIFLQNEIDPEATLVNLPYNNLQVVAGGFSMLKVATGPIKDAEVMQVEVPALARDLALIERYDRFFPVFEMAYNVMLANRSQVLNRIAGSVDKGLKRGLSVIKDNGALLRGLRPALAIKADPMYQALLTKADNQRREDAIRSDEQSKMAPGNGGAQPPTTTTTVSTTSPAAPLAPPTPDKAPVGHGKKK